MSRMPKEGWFRDPAGRHEWRWFSDGSPTDLVRDAEHTSRDALLPEEVTAYAQLVLAQPPDTAPSIYHPDEVTPKSVVLGGGISNVVSYEPR